MTAAEQPVKSLPAIVMEIDPEHSDAYERRPGSVLKLFPTQLGHSFARIGIRQGSVKAEARLHAGRLRRLVAALTERADLLEGAPEPDTPGRLDLDTVLRVLADDEPGNGGEPAIVAWGVTALGDTLHRLLQVAAQHRQGGRPDLTWGCRCGWVQDKPHREHVADMLAAARKAVP